jgi:RHS repeat-associated protein
VAAKFLELKLLKVWGRARSSPSSFFLYVRRHSPISVPGNIGKPTAAPPKARTRPKKEAISRGLSDRPGWAITGDDGWATTTRPAGACGGSLSYVPQYKFGVESYNNKTITIQCVNSGYCLVGQTSSFWINRERQVDGPVPPPPPKCGGCEDGKDEDVGNPIDPATGNKYERETDIAGGASGLTLTRSYNSQLTHHDLGLGFGWSSTPLAQLKVFGVIVHLIRASGRGEVYSCPSSGVCTKDADALFTLTKDASGYTLSHKNGSTQRFGTHGLLQSETDSTGKTATYAYGANNKLSVVTGPYGHTLSFTYNGSRIATVTSGAGTLSYSYDANGNLIKVTYPNGQAKHYHYENTAFPRYLTGISHEEMGGPITRYATFAYDTSGMAVLTEHAGGVQRYTATYDAITQTTVKDVANVATVISFSQPQAVSGWNFNGTTDGWMTYNATATTAADRITMTATAVDPQLYRSVSSFSGRTNRYVMVRLRQTAAGAWEGKLFYATAGHGYSASYYKGIPMPTGLTVGGDWVTAVWDMHNLSAGGSDWMNNSITSLRLDFSNASGAQFQIDWIRHGDVNYANKNAIAKMNVTDGKSVAKTFDPNNNLTCKKDEEGRVTTYTYNSTNQKLSETVGRLGSCASPITTSATRTTTYTYKSPTVSLPTSITRPSVYAGQSAVTTLTYGDASKPNLPTVITQSGYTPTGTPVSRAVSLTYNAAGQVASINGPRTDVNDVTTLAYHTCTTGGACGQLASVTNALGHVTTYNSYDANGRVTQVTAPNGLVTGYAYDARGRVVTVTQTPPGGGARVTRYTYNAAGDVTSVTFPDGVALAYTYNAARKLTRVTDNAGNYVDYSYDLKGNRTAETTRDPAGALVRSLSTAYDLRNRASHINAGGSVTTLVHDALGNLLEATDPNQGQAGSGLKTTHQYDALNRLLGTIDALSGTTSYGYDKADRLTQVTAPNNATTAYAYDDLGNLLSETSPDRGTTTYAYDAAGNLLQKTDARGVTVSYSYDALNRVTSIDYPGTSEDVSLAYDSGPYCTAGIGRLCEVVDGSGTTQFGYDAFGNVITHRTTALGVTYVTSYTVDAGDRVLSLTYPSGRTVTYGRDTLRRVSHASALVNGATQTLVSGRTYRADGRLTGQSFGNGINEVRDYNLKGELTYQAVGAIDTRLYGYDPNGNLTSLQSLPQVGSYHYDALDRLTTDQITSSPSSTRSFTYDGNGNRLSENGTSYHYTNNTNRLTQRGTTTITTDNAGNTTNDGTYTYVYNNDGHLHQVLQGTTVIATYTYNHQRQRTRKVTANGTTLFHYDLEGNLIAETQANGTPLKEYVWVDSVPVAQITIAGGETVAYLHTDHLGTPRVATDGSQSKVWGWEGEACGATSPTGSITNNLRFAGQYYDSETGLHYNWNRYFDPRSCRYISSDPIGLEGGINTYVYVNGNPLRWIDPTGESAAAEAAGVGAVVFCARNPQACVNAARALGAALGIGGGATMAPTNTDDSRNDASSESRSIPMPDRPSCGCTCICRADANDNIPGNIKPGDKTFAFGQATAANCAEASKQAKRAATRALGKQPKHVGCRCNGS